MERLRLLWEEDRKAERDGVWLPDALDRKYPNADREWGGRVNGFANAV